MSTPAIPIYDSWRAAQARCTLILRQEYNNVLRELYPVTMVGGVPLTIDGLYLPLLGNVYNLPGPSRTEDGQRYGGPVVAYLGPVAEARDGDYRQIGGRTHVTRELPFGAMIVIQEAPQADITEGGRDLEPEEILLARTYRYLGALIECLTRYGCQHSAVLDVTPRADFALGGEIGLKNQTDGATLFAIAFLDFDVSQHASYPRHAPLPAPPTP